MNREKWLLAYFVHSHRKSSLTNSHESVVNN